tara:strand:- start:99593 stop:99955 length:363 start_codon:yes stop_codon:yes gene_type:complete
MDLMQVVPAIRGLVEEEGFKCEYENKDYAIIIASLGDKHFEFNVDTEKRNNAEERVLLFVGAMNRQWNEEDEQENPVKEICRVDIHDPDSLDKVRVLLQGIRDEPESVESATATAEPAAE